LKNTYRGRKFHDLDELFREIVRQANRLARTGAANGLQMLPRRWERVIEMEGSYFEGV
jgi:hypothetical protein